jgi:hypothetical protein
MRTFFSLSSFTLAVVVSLASQIGVPARAEEHFGHPGGRPIDGHGHVLDNRYNHGHYYPAVGSSVRVLPDGYRPYFFGGRHYYFFGGVWYAPGPAGFLVVGAPIGLAISALPPYYSTVWIGGVPYYYANDVYYTWNAEQNAYVVVAPPAGADQPGSPPAPAAQQDLIIYPKNGQTNEQQAADRYDCHSWAKSQSGFDPTQPGGGVAPANYEASHDYYERAMSACLTGRGYEVK